MKNKVYSFVVQYPGTAYYNVIDGGNDVGFKIIGKFKNINEAAKACLLRADKICKLYRAKGLPEPEFLNLDYIRKYYVKD